MRFFAAIVGIGLIGVVLVDAFETILQPRRVTHRFRFARLFYRTIWGVWRTFALQVFRTPRRREAFLAIFGPFSLLALFTTWVTVLIFGFALVHWSLDRNLRAPEPQPGFLTALYLSGSTLLTLGFGDVTPVTTFGRALVVVQAGLGFAFLAIIISYLPILYQTFSRRETTISLLDARAGSPPSAAELLDRVGRARADATLHSFLVEWEHWSAELLEGLLSFPVLAYYRSQHDNQSWLAALTTILDACALLLAEVEADGDTTFQAQLTFAVARHAAVDLALVLKTRPNMAAPDRLPAEQRHQLRARLRDAGLRLRDGGSGESNQRLTELRGMYDPFVDALAERFLLALPRIYSQEPAIDNWQRSAWMKRAPGIGALPGSLTDQEHFE